MNKQAYATSLSILRCYVYAFCSKAATYFKFDLFLGVSECSFPARWEGTWFQSGVRQSILISKNELSSKGKCLHNEGDKFLLVDQ